MLVSAMPRPRAHIHEVACAGVAPKAAAAWNTMTTELVKPTSTATKPATQIANSRLRPILSASQPVIGVAIAWAVTEHLHDRIGCRTMFATHYHELMQLPEKLQHARNCNVAVKERGDRIVFLHRLEPGGTDRSYGIHVAELAGLPGSVVTRAKGVLATLETGHRMVPGKPPRDPDPAQPSLFDPAAPAAPEPPRPNPLGERLRALDPDRMTPLEALQELARLRSEADGD